MANGCGCGTAQPGELWRAYRNDGTASEPMSKAMATREVALNGGYILQVSADQEQPVTADAAA